MTTDTLPTVCAWHFAMTPSRLIPLAGTTVDQALLAIEDGSISHGICDACDDAYRLRFNLEPRRA